MKTRVKGQNLTHRIADRIGVAIITGVYSADNPIPIEARLCRDYDASRPVLREAVKMLTAKGLLAARPRLGTWVQSEERWNLLDPDVLGWLLERRFSRALLIEFAELRLAVEPRAAMLAATMASREHQAAIRRAIERMQLAERGADDPLEADIAFHVAVLRASGNRFYAQLTGFSATALRFSIRLTSRHRGVRLASVAAHQKVASAILAGKPRVAGEAMRRLIQAALDIISRNAAPRAPAQPASGRRRLAAQSTR